MSGPMWVIVDGALSFSLGVTTPSVTLTGSSAGLALAGTTLNINDYGGGARLRIVNGGPVQINSSPLAIGTAGTSKFAMQLNGSTDANVVFVNGAGTVGVGVDITTDGTIAFKTRAFADTAIIACSAFKTTTALVALGGGATPTLGTIGASGPTTAAQNTWLRLLDSTGAAFWVPAWK
jgi:hypothetical protein